MRMNEQDKAAIATDGAKCASLEMTPERKERVRVASYAITDLLKQKTESPYEAYLVLRGVVSAMEKTYGILGQVVIETSDEKGPKA